MGSETEQTVQPEIAESLQALSSPAARLDPYPHYRRLRDRAPVLRTGGHWVLTSHGDCVALLSDAGWSQLPEGETMCLPDRQVSLAPSAEPLDPSAHNPNYLRRFLAREFSPKALRRQEPRLQAVIDRLLVPVLDAGEADLVETFAEPLPAHVMAELFGIPASDRTPFAGWASALVRRLDLAPMSATDVERERLAREQFRDYFRGLITDRRRFRGEDLLSSLLSFEEQGGRLTEDQLLDACIVILIAGGYGAPADFISLGVLSLSANDREWRRFQAVPAIAGTAVEELLRYDGPSQILTRVALRDTEIGGRQVRRGDSALVVLGAANRDPAVFAEPDRLDLTRQPNPHLQFGYGQHSCGGMSLARLEMRLTFATLAGRAHSLTVVGDPEWKGTVSSRGLTKLPVSLR